MSLLERREALQLIQEDIEKEMAYFNYSQLVGRAKATKLSDLTYATDGKPIINVIITTFRSGSNFMGNILNSYPGSYIHHETLIHYNVYRLRDRTKGKNAANDVNQMLHCNYLNQKEMLHRIQWSDNHDTLKRNWRVWKRLDNEMKYTLDFITNACKLFPIQSMKLTRLLLRDARSLLEDASLNVKVIFLVRDPRGVIPSRRNLAK